MCRVSQWQWHYPDDFGLQEGAHVTWETDLVRTMPRFPASWPHERTLSPKASFHFATGISYLLQSLARRIYFQVQGMCWKEKLCCPVPQNSLSSPLLKASDWAGWNRTKPAIQTPGQRRLVTTLPYPVTHLGSQVSALCCLHAKNASLERRGHLGLMFEECRTGINACGN